MAGTREIFTRTMAADEVITITGTQGFTTISILCKTDASGSKGITILGTLGAGSVPSNIIKLLANEIFAVGYGQG